MSLLILLPSIGLADVVINEVLYNPSGSDSGHEWVELYNNGSADVDISGWEIQAGTSSFGTKGTISSGILAPGTYYLIGESDVAADIGIAPGLVVSLGLGNGTSSIDGLRIVDANGAVKDTVLYGDSATIGTWEDDNGPNPTSFAPEAGSAESIARIPNGIDTNLSGDDFQLISNPTPMAENIGGSSTTCVNTTFSGIVINEVLYDPPSSDSGNEWVELLNTTGDDIDVSGWMLEAGTSSFGLKGTIPDSTVIPAGGYYLIGEDLVGSTLGQAPDLVTTLSMGNASNVDGVRLVDCNSVPIDTVLYGEDLDGQSWEDDNGPSPTSFAPDASSASIARIPNGADTDLSGDDFQIIGNPTPWNENIGGSSTTCDNSVFEGIVINEILYDPPGSDSDFNTEWIEIMNTTEEVVDISGWEIQAGTSSFSTKGTFPNNTFLPAGGYFLIGEDEVVLELGQEPDLIANLNLGNATSSVDAVRLVDCDSVTIDTVLYGDDLGSDEWEDDNGPNPTSFAPEGSDGEAIGRMPDGVDTDLSGDDFEILPFPTPWVANDVVAVCDGQFAIKINEFLPNPHTILDDGTEISDDDGREWVELYNNSGVDVDLAGWKIQWGGSTSYTNEIAIPSGTTISANGLLLIGGEEVENADVITPLDNDLDMTLASSNGDGLRLLHCGPGVADTVIYGNNNDDGFLDDDENIATSFAPKPQEGLSIARMTDGSDTNQSGVDFAVANENTPGESNPEIICGEGDFQIKINEIYPNPEGSDGGQEFVELYNAGSETVRLDSWSIEVGGASWSSKASIPPGMEIGPGEFFLIGESESSDVADYSISSNLSLGNASSSLAGVRLVNCLGAIEDTILYGESDIVPDETSEVTDDLGGYIFVTMSESGKTIGRYPDGVDSDDNVEDFQTNMEPTPGTSNDTGDPIGQPDSGPDGDPPTGCRKNSDPSGEDDPSKCSYVGSFSPMLWMISLVMLWRRRE